MVAQLHENFWDLNTTLAPTATVLTRFDVHPGRIQTKGQTPESFSEGVPMFEVGLIILLAGLAATIFGLVALCQHLSGGAS